MFGSAAGLSHVLTDGDVGEPLAIGGEGDIRLGPPGPATVAGTTTCPSITS